MNLGGGYQPYHQHAGRPQGDTLRAMLRGSPFHLPNPMDIQRQAQKLSRPRRSRLAQLLRELS